MAQAIAADKHRFERKSEKLTDLASVRLAREPWRWTDALQDDRKLNSGDRDIARAILKFINRKSGRGWPSHATIAAAIGKSDRQVRRSIARLKDRGFIDVAVGGGGTIRVGGALQGRAATYLLRLPNSLDPTVAETQYPDIHVRMPGHQCPTNLKNRTSDYKKDRNRWITEKGASRAKALSRIGILSTELLHFTPKDKAPDGRYYDAIIIEALPSEKLESLIKSARAGQADEADLAAALADAHITRDTLPTPLRAPQEPTTETTEQPDVMIQFIQPTARAAALRDPIIRDRLENSSSLVTQFPACRMTHEAFHRAISRN